MGILDGLKPEKVFRIFEEISSIPRGSGNEAKIAEYCVKFGKDRGLEAFSDKSNNVVIKKSAANGMESRETVILQGHLDMVCEKNAGIEHDFLKDPIKLKVEGDDIKAIGTTLGADNGIAVAMALAVLEEDFENQGIELLFTSEEETGLTGAMNFDYGNLSGKYLINLDSEEYGKATVGCAGGLRTDTEIAINWKDTSLSDAETYAIRVRGLKGGHSGQDINIERANANKLIGRTLNYIYGKIDYEICSITGGSKDNAIPRESQAYVNINENDAEKLEELLSAFEKTVLSEFRLQESEVSIKCSREEKQTRVFCKETAQKAISLIMVIPNGVQAMSFEIADLVETSCNLGVITMEGDALKLACSIRSSVGSRKIMVTETIKNAALLAGAKFSTRSDYPGWRYEPESKLREAASSVFKELTGSELETEAIHAGLECGIIKEKMPQTDIISFGPDMWDVHTPDERLSISSVGKAYEFLVELLKQI